VHVAVGTFDGVHLGHQALLGGLADEAHRARGLAVAFTFQNHPRSVVAPASCPPLLTPWPRKRDLLAALPLDYAVALRFDERTAAIEAADFVRDVLVGRCRATHIHSGRNFHFGRGGRGNPDLLARLGPALGYAYERLEPLALGGERISSTRIRGCLAAGAVAVARALLGRPHDVTGRVVAGDAIGRTIGFPTANLAVAPGQLLPADGVYAVRVSGAGLGGVPGMLNLGHRPTVGGREHRCEVHLIGFEGELVGSELTVAFHDRLRDEQRFAGLEELTRQLARDREAARAALGAD
jgi:riboflavin kinase/FMN adenylyltransferase